MIDSHPIEWEGTLQKMLTMDWERLIPGHPGAPNGRLGTKQDVKDQWTNLLITANQAWCGRRSNTSHFALVVKHKAEGFIDVEFLDIASQYSMLHSRRVGIGK